MKLTFDDYINEALSWNLSGWDFQAFNERWIEELPSWDYIHLVSSKLAASKSLLDMGTGGGELLSSLKGLPELVCATESYKPNIPVARKRLESLGIKVYEFDSDSELPLENEQFDLVINKHESFDAPEVLRILKPGGIFLTQQVGGQDNIKLNQLLNEEAENEFHAWNLSKASKNLVDEGFDLLDSKEEYPETIFTDIGAVVVVLRAIPWQIPDFSVEVYRVNLHKLHNNILSSGQLTVNSHRFFIEARKPND